MINSSRETPGPADTPAHSTEHDAKHDIKLGSTPRIAATRFASLSTAATIALVLLSIIFDWAILAAGAAALVMLIAALFVANPRSRAVAVILITIGVLCAISSIVWFDSSFDLAQLGRLNQDMVTMLAAGAFIRGVFTFRKSTTPPRLTGGAAVLRTSYVNHFMGSVLNFVAIGIVSERLQRLGRLSVNNAALVSQSFVTGALWSPFWTVTALVVAYFPTVAFLPISATGLMFAIAIIAVSALWNVKRRTPEELREPGFPLQPYILALPVALMVFVMVGHAFLPDIPVPRIVILASLVIPFFLGTVRSGIRKTSRQFTRIATRGLTSSSNEVVLFISAGIFTLGGSMLTAHLPFQLSAITPTVLTAWLLTVAMVLLSMVGVHPVVTVSVAAAMAMFVPEGGVLYATAIFWGWAVASTVGPLAGTVIYLSQRFGVRDRSLIVANMPFMLFGVTLAYPAIYVTSLLSAAWA